MSEKLIQIALVGSPNVGKSLLFNYLTGQYVTVSNYPGTTVDIAKGNCNIKGRQFEVIDTPGIYSLTPLTEEETVTRKILYNNKPDIVLHVIDAKNIERMLPLTLQLIDTGMPVILILNIMDEAKKLGMKFNVKLLSDILGIPILTTSAIEKQGLDLMKKVIATFVFNKYQPNNFTYNAEIEQAAGKIAQLLEQEYFWDQRMISLLFLQEDRCLQKFLAAEQQGNEITEIIKKIKPLYNQGITYQMAMERQVMIHKLLKLTVFDPGQKENKRVQFIDKYTRIPVTGIPILLCILYIVYLFVGKFGAEIMVDWINQIIFISILNPVIEMLIYSYIPYEWLQTLIVGDYGIYTLGVRYAVMIVLPIVGTFFLLFSVLEDSGYLPRIAMLLDGVFRYFGLNGRAVIPVTLGFGCGTMAVMVTRTLQSNRERIITTLLLAICIPCSAQLGVVLGILSHNSLILMIWAISIIFVFMIIGWVSNKLICGKRSEFYMELPPLRLPVTSNVLFKAYHRMIWYFMEILPLFVATSIVLWGCDEIGLLPILLSFMQPLMSVMGLPAEVAQIFLLGFFRRDYGAAGLYDLCIQGILTDGQLLIAALTLTLFLPCVAQMVVMVKERGLLTSLCIIAVTITIAIGTGMGMSHLVPLFSL